MAHHYLQDTTSLTPLEPEEEPPCASAMAFSAFCQQLIDYVAEKKGKEEEGARLNVAYIRLQHRYFEYKDRLNDRHTNERGSRKHPCVGDLYAETYHRLRQRELDLTGLPTTPKAPAPRAKRYLTEVPDKPKSIAELLLEG